MKKIILLLSAVCVFSITQAQRAGFGIRAGANFAHIKTETNNVEVKTNSQTGLNAGFFAEIPVSTNFRIQPELAYSMLGYENENVSPSVKGKFSYLTLPVLAKYMFPGSGFGVYAGPQVGVLLSAQREQGNTETDIKQNLKSTDFALVFGPEFTIPNTGLVISGRYQFGLTNIDKNAPSGTSTRNNAATVTLGYRF